MDNNSKLTPAEIESNKTPRQKAEDVAYTMNHTLVCTATDFIDPIFGNFIQKKLGNKSQLPNAYAAEFIGDFGSIPITIAAQRFFPTAMSWIRKAAEPMLKGIFLSSAERNAKGWATEHGYVIGSEEYKQKVSRIYEYEMSHIPQAVVWTVSAVGLNVAAQVRLGNKAPVHHIAAGKIGASALSAVLTLGGRSMFPRKAEKFDKWTSKNIILPIEDTVYDVLKIKHDDKEYYLDNAKYNDKNSHDWVEKVKSSKNDKIATVNI